MPGSQSLWCRSLKWMGLGLLGAAATLWPGPRAADPAQAASEPAGSAAVTVYQHPELGQILADSRGRVLYVYLRDKAGESTCYGTCADRWPPLLIGSDQPVAGPGVKGKLGVTRRQDGRLQVTYQGMPLYYWAQDRAAGEASGQGVAGVWFVAPADPATTTTPRLQVAQHPELGSYVVDAYGRTLYLFERDSEGVSNCYDRCEQLWPVLRGQPRAGAGVTGAIGSTQRRDGSSQVTLAGRPLYYYAGDTRPGELNGQDRGEVWYVVSPAGAAVKEEEDEKDATAAEITRSSQASGNAGAPATAAVTIRGFAYVPADLRVRVGTTVVWTNEDAIPHTVTASQGKATFDSGTLRQGQVYRYTFTQEGTYAYVCELHANMKGTVTVVR